MKLSTGKTKPKLPRYQKGNQCHHWLVVKYAGYGRFHPITGREYTKCQHYYLVRCPCGHEEVRTQNDLNPRVSKKPPLCIKCKTGTKAKPVQPEKTPHVSTLVPDFAKMKL